MLFACLMDFTLLVVFTANNVNKKLTAMLLMRFIDSQIV
ncbi:hypothetical protein TPHV1_30168 [Treponema phagedenis]|uniref:Uncharacterized protein n=1 Tax=Treponema phagedenis TaxID=162 RepID=A0A0B7GUU9_TREPH|nr:hypothetical protein TPHV1_30168 [Treponema phagedenis]